MPYFEHLFLKPSSKQNLILCYHGVMGMHGNAMANLPYIVKCSAAVMKHFAIFDCPYKDLLISSQSLGME